MKIFKNFCAAVILLLCSCALFACAGDSTPVTLNLNTTLGVWWWNNRLDSSYLTFAADNGVDEIYYYTSTFDENNKSFIESAAGYNISVYWLTGDYTWIENPQDFYNEMEKYLSFQESSEHKFAGVHLDVEPHQHPQFEERRNELITKYVEFIYNVTNRYPQVSFDVDIPFWLEDEITFENETKEAYKFLMDYADRTFIMSYRDSAEGIVNVASDELSYASTINKEIFLGVETGEEEDIVTFLQEGKNYLYNELNNLNKFTELNYNVSIHHIKTWKNLKN